MKKWKSVKSINPWPSVIQTIYDIVKAHGGELKVETKEGEGSEFIIQLPVVWITDLIGLKDYTNEYYYKWKKWKSLKSINPWPSVIQTIYDIVKAHGGELKMATKEGEGSEFIIQLPVVWITDLIGLKDYTDEYYYKWKNKISEIRKSVAIRDSDNLRYCKSTWWGIKVETKEGEGSEFII